MGMRWAGWTHVNAATGAFGGAPYGATNRVRGVPKWVARTHVDSATGAFGGAPYGATNRVMGCADMGGADACGHRHWGLRWSSQWGHETCEGCAGMGRVIMRTLPEGPSVELPMGPRNA